MVAKPRQKISALVFDFLLPPLLTLVKIKVTPPFHRRDVAEPPAKYAERAYCMAQGH
jgi:hypothetical protein